MKVIIIYEENNGIIGVASTRKAAANFIVKEGWFKAHDKVWVRLEHRFRRAHELMDKPCELVTHEELVDFIIEAKKSIKYDFTFSFNEEEVLEEE